MKSKGTLFFGFCFVLFIVSYLTTIYISTNNKDFINGDKHIIRHKRDVSDSNTTVPPKSEHSTEKDSETHEMNHEEYHQESEEHNERFKVISVNWTRVSDPFIISLWIVFAGIAKIVFHYMNRIVSRVPESCLLICLGLIVGGIAYAVNRKHRIEELLFNPDTFFLFILPPIVMEAGYFMPKDPFLDNLGSILVYAIIGTIFNAMCIGLSLYGVYKGNLMPDMNNLGLLDCLLFGSIISAVDPVAVISVFEEIHVNTVLYICVFGESLLNDGVAVVLFHMFEGYIEIGEANIQTIDIVAAIASFFVVALGGLLIGIIYGYIASFITKFTHHNRIVEPTFVFVSCYMAYLTAEIFHLSGIIAIVFAGFSMNSYVEHNISQKSHTTVKYGMKMMANVCETIIFMLLGIAAVSDFWQYWNTAFVLWTLFFITIYRCIGVVFLTAILNYFRLDKINRVDQFVMAYGGLRGAIAFSLVSLTSAALVPSIKTMVCACIVCILFTSFVQGSTIRPIVEFLHVKTTSSHKLTMMEDINLRLIEHLMAGVEDIIGHHGHHYWEQKWTRFNTDYLMKWFVREPYFSHDAEILETFHRINKREAAGLLQEIGKGSFANGMQSEKTLANLLLASDIRRTGSHTSLGAMIKENNSSDVCLDIRSIEAKAAPVNGTVSDAHHMLKENMYKPRTVDISYRRGDLPVDSRRKRQEQEILIRRKIQQRKKGRHRKHHKYVRHGSRPHFSEQTKYSHSSSRHNNGLKINDDEPIPLLSGHVIDSKAGYYAPEITLNVPGPEPEDTGITFSANETDGHPGNSDPLDNEDESQEPTYTKELPWKTSLNEAVMADPNSKANLMHLDISPRASREFLPPPTPTRTTPTPGEENLNQSSNNTERTSKSDSAIETQRFEIDDSKENNNSSNDHEGIRKIQFMIGAAEWETIDEDVL